MLQAILEGLANGMRRMWGFASGIVLWPFSLFGRAPRPGAIGQHKEAIKAVEQAALTSAPKSPDISDSLKRDAQIAWSCVATAMLTRMPLQFPPPLSKTMRGWLQGLDHDALEKLRAAGAGGIVAHFSGKTLIPGVPKVTALTRVELRFPPAPVRKLDAELSEFRFSPT